MIDSSAIPRPLEAIRTYFHDASRAASVRSIATSSRRDDRRQLQRNPQRPEVSDQRHEQHRPAKQVQQREIAPREPREVRLRLIDAEIADREHRRHRVQQARGQQEHRAERVNPEPTPGARQHPPVLDRNRDRHRQSERDRAGEHRRCSCEPPAAKQR